MGSSDTLRSVIDAGRSSKRLDELSSARVIGKIALQAHAAQQKAGAGKAIGPLTPTRIGLASNGAVTLEPSEANAVGYSAPEQITGSIGDRRSDVFSLGAVMWEALTHQRLFDAMNDAAVKVAVQDREIQSPAEVNANIPAELSAICMRALSRNPTDRYQSLKAMAVEIEEYLEEAGETDDDTKIAQYLAGMPRKAAASVAPPLGQQPAAGTLPPATRNVPDVAPGGPTLPSILTSEPERPKSTSGSALAAALANAKSAPATSTMIGVPVASDWQDRTPPPHTAPPVAVSPPQVAATPTMPLPAKGVTMGWDVVADPTPTAPPSAQPMPEPLTPRPPVLPTGSQAALRPDKSTISVSVPPQVRVATTIEAKHVEAKPAAIIIEDKPKATIVDDPVEAAVAAVVPKAIEAGAARPQEDLKATLVDTMSPALLNAAEDAMADAAKAETAKAEAAKTDAAKADAVKTDAAKADAAKADAVKADAAEADAAKADVATSATAPAMRLAAANDAGTADTERVKKGTGPHPAAVVALPKTGRESKGDLLAGWGWGTDKHEAIAPSGYAANDEDEYPPPNSKKTLIYVIGGGLALALMVVIVAFAAGGSTKKVKPTAKQLAAEKAKKEAELAAAQTPAPPPAAAPIEPAVDPAVKAAEDKAAADKAAADKIAADKAAAEQATAAEKAEREAKMSEADRKKAETAQAKLDAEAARQAEADRRKADAAQAADKKAEAKRIAAEEAAAKKSEADAARAARKAEAAAKAAEAPKNPTTTTTVAKTTTTPKTDTRRPDTKTTTSTKTVATGDPKTTTTPKSDVNPETAYRQGLQAFARGDTTGALASLRSSLAANPNYAPTWRGLGLVFEKMGEKDQAKAAYRRYLQLAPTAGDAEIIRGRMERLGS